MPRISNAVLAISYLALSIASAHSATLRMGTQDDPDALDPALSGTCVGSIIFTSLCDKLVDISHDLKIVVKIFIPSQFPDQNHRRQLRDQQLNPAWAAATSGPEPGVASTVPAGVWDFLTIRRYRLSKYWV